MTKQKKYTAELSKGQGLIPEMVALLHVWQSGMTVRELKKIVLEEGVISRATALRVNDIVGRLFSIRFLSDDARPALYMKRLVEAGIPPGKLSQLFLIYAARAHNVLFDFICDVYWPKYASGSSQITKQDALLFLELAEMSGKIAPRWSQSTMERIGRYLPKCLEDFGMAGSEKSGSREILPFTVSSLTTLYYTHEIHFTGVNDNSILEQPDWRLFGLEPRDVVNELQRVANPHFIPQYSGDLLRISWKYKTMEEALDAIIAAEL